MTFEEFLSFHNQWSASMEANMAALVEAQQRNDEQIRLLGEQTREQIRSLAEAQQQTNQQIQGLVRVADGTLGLVREVIRKVDDLATAQKQGGERQRDLGERQREAEERQRRSDQRVDRLVESIQRFIDAQSRRNGGD